MFHWQYLVISCQKKRREIAGLIIFPEKNHTFCSNKMMNEKFNTADKVARFSNKYY